MENFNFDDIDQLWYFCVNKMMSSLDRFCSFIAKQETHHCEKSIESNINGEAVDSHQVSMIENTPPKNWSWDRESKSTITFDDTVSPEIIASILLATFHSMDDRRMLIKQKGLTFQNSWGNQVQRRGIPLLPLKKLKLAPT